MSPEDIVQLMAENTQLNQRLDELSKISAEAHRNAATWAAAAGELMRILGKKTLAEEGWEPPK